MDNLDDALADLRRAMDRFATTYVTSVARTLEKELSLAVPLVDLMASGRMAKRAMECPATNVHSAHTWRFPDSDTTRKCPGVTEGLPDRPFFRGFPVERCLLDTPHDEHDWERDPNSRPAPAALGAHCPGIPAEGDPVPVKRCPRYGSHGSHNWEDPSDAHTMKVCTGWTNPAS